MWTLSGPHQANTGLAHCHPEVGSMETVSSRARVPALILGPERASAHPRRSETLSIFASDDRVRRLLMVGEGIAGSIPGQFHVRVASSLGREQGWFGNADTILEWCPQLGLLAHDVVDPGVPVVQFREIRKSGLGSRCRFGTYICPSFFDFWPPSPLNPP